MEPAGDPARFTLPLSATQGRCMADLAGWIALVATAIAAIMTAANLGARVTGYGFVVFTVGAAAWIVNGFLQHQTQLLWSNLFLGVVDLVGVWRWLGLRARFSDAARAEESRSEAEDGGDLFSVGKLDGLPVVGPDGTTLAHVVDALAHCEGGSVAFVIVREGGTLGVGETLRRLPWREIRVSGDQVLTGLDMPAVQALPVASSR